MKSELPPLSGDMEKAPSHSTPDPDRTLSQEQMVAMNEQLIVSSLRQHELTAAAEKLNAQLLAEITAREHAQQALKDSEQRMRLATEATGVGIWEWNVITGEIRWDDMMFRIYGITPTANGVVQYSDWSETVLPEDLHKHEAVLRDTVAHDNRSGKEFAGILYDITSRKEREIALADREAHLRRVINNQLGGRGVFDPIRRRYS